MPTLSVDHFATIKSPKPKLVSTYNSCQNAIVRAQRSAKDAYLAHSQGFSPTKYPSNTVHCLYLEALLDATNTILRVIPISECSSCRVEVVHLVRSVEMSITTRSSSHSLSGLLYHAQITDILPTKRCKRGVALKRCSNQLSKMVILQLVILIALVLYATIKRCRIVAPILMNRW